MKKKPIYKRRWFVVLAVFIFMGMIGSFIEDDDAETVKTVESTTETTKTVESTVESTKTIETTTTTDSSEPKLYDLTTNLNNFPVFLKDFETKYNSELDKSKAYNSMVKGKQATWTGTVVEVWSTRVILIESSKYREGLTWEDIRHEDLQYYTFFARFENGTPRSDFVVGEEKTITGKPGVRATNTDKYKTWWTLRKAEVK